MKPGKGAPGRFSRREFLKTASVSALSLSAGMQSLSSARADTTPPLNILMIVTDQEHYIDPANLPVGYSLPGHERLAKRGVVFENHQISSCVCTPSRAVLYTGQHIQNNGLFDNTNFPWSSDLSTDIDTVGDLLRREGYYTAYKGKWHLTDEFETANDLHAPKKILVDEMEEYGFSDYFGIGDIIAHTEGGYLHDDVISAMTRSWLRGKGEQLRQENKPWFMAVNLVNPHDVMYYNTDLEGKKEQAKGALMRLNREPRGDIYQAQWDFKLPQSRKQALEGEGRPPAHIDFMRSRSALVGSVPNEDERWRRLNNYYLNCIRDVDRNMIKILDELDGLGLSDNTVIIFTSDHGEMAGGHGLSGKGATAYREQNNVPLTIVHPSFDGNKRCKAVTSHVDIATTLLSIASGKTSEAKELPGKNMTELLANPEASQFETLRVGALYNYNMFAYVDGDFLTKVADFILQGGDPSKLADQGLKPDMTKRGAIRSIYDGRYKFSRYFSPSEHHIPKTMEQLLAHNDLELFDLINDPLEMKNLAFDVAKNGELILAMNDKLSLMLETEVGEDLGQMLPGGEGVNWQLSSDILNLRM